jgi:hypothetical protein
MNISILLLHDSNSIDKTTFNAYSLVFLFICSINILIWLNLDFLFEFYILSIIFPYGSQSFGLLELPAHFLLQTELHRNIG